MHPEWCHARHTRGIEEVIFMEDKHHDDDIYVASREILKECGISTRQHKFEKINITVDI